MLSGDWRNAANILCRLVAPRGSGVPDVAVHIGSGAHLLDARIENNHVEFGGPRRFELTAQKAFDLGGLGLELARQHLYGIALTSQARFQIVEVWSQCG